MGLLVNGKWQDRWYETASNNGEFVRQSSQFRHRITAHASAGGTEVVYPAEPGRYHLFVSLACPWAHRTLIFRKLKQLEEVIGVTVVDPKMLSNGWEFSEVSEDNPLGDIDYLYEVYLRADSNYTGRVTVPVLWDKKTNTIVNNESAEIIRMLNTAFNAYTDVKTNFYPDALQAEIDAINSLVYDTINNGVYRAGFATTQQAYEKAFHTLFDSLDELDARLEGQRYLAGNTLTEADWRLFTTLIRFDSVYHGHFKTNLRRIEDYANLGNYLRELYQHPGIAETVDFEHIKTHYYYSHDTINPTRVVPVGPDIDYARAHNRDRLALAA